MSPIPWRAARFRQLLGAHVHWSGRDLYRASPPVTWDYGFPGLLLKPPYWISLYDQQGVLWTYSTLDGHETIFSSVKFDFLNLPKIKCLMKSHQLLYKFYFYPSPLWANLRLLNEEIHTLVQWFWRKRSFWLTDTQGDRKRWWENVDQKSLLKLSAKVSLTACLGTGTFMPSCLLKYVTFTLVTWSWGNPVWNRSLMSRTCRKSRLNGADYQRRLWKPRSCVMAIMSQQRSLPAQRP